MPHKNIPQTIDKSTFLFQKKQRALKLARRYACIFAVSSLFLNYSGSAIAEVDTLRSAVKNTLDTNPSINSQLNEFLASQHDARIIYGGYLPSINFDASIGAADRSYDSRGNYNRNYAELSLTQMLFDGFNVRNNLEKANHSSRALYYDLLNEAENKALESSLTYLDVLRYRKLIELSHKNLSHSLRIQKNVTERTESGVGNRADQLQADGRVALARSNVLTEVANLQSVTSRFFRLVGRLPYEEMSDINIPEDVFPNNLEEALKTSYRNNPELYSAYENIHAATYSLEATKSNRYPTIALAASQGIYKNNNSFDERTDEGRYGDELIVELTLNYNLYNGGSDRAAEKGGYDRIGQAQSIRDNVCANLRQTATIAFTDIVNISFRTVFLQKHLASSVDVLEAYREQYIIGRRTLLDVLDSENEVYQAERSHVAATYDLQAAKLRTLGSMGLLLSSLSQSTSKIPALDDTFSQRAVTDENHYCSISPDGQLSLIEYIKPTILTEPITLYGSALFDIGSAQINEVSYNKIKYLADQISLKESEINSIYIIGHTDSTGSDELNRDLSMRRAVAVKAFFVTAGIEADLIQIEGVGASKPVASNTSINGRSQNRVVNIRIEISE